MTQAFDGRIIRLGLQMDGKTTTYDQSFHIRAVGLRYANANLSECEIRIDNINKDIRDYLLSTSSPFLLRRDKLPTVTLDVGRESFGTFRLFQGGVIACSPSQPPDIGITFRSLSLCYMAGKLLAVSFPENATLKQISKQVADNLGLTLSFEATDKNVGNYTFTGAALKQVQKLGEAGDVNAFIDNDVLHVRDSYTIAKNPILINKKNGMVGVPEVSEEGVRVKFLINSEIKTSHSITIESDINPAANGTFQIYKLGFEVDSRAMPFYFNIEAKKYRPGVVP